MGPRYRWGTWQYIGLLVCQMPTDALKYAVVQMGIGQYYMPPAIDVGELLLSHPPPYCVGFRPARMTMQKWKWPSAEKSFCWQVLRSQASEV